MADRRTAIALSRDRGGARHARPSGGPDFHQRAFRRRVLGRPRGGPSSSLCVKGYFNEFGWIARHVGEPEAFFYRDLAAPAGIRTLSSVYADVDPETRHGVVITEDVVADGGVFLDGRSPYTPEQTAASLSELATVACRDLDAAAMGDDTVVEVALWGRHAGLG